MNAVEPARLRTAVYVDGFNLYYGALKGSAYKWLDVRKMVDPILHPDNDVVLFKYFTAPVRATPDDPGAPSRQNVYLRALKANDPALEIIKGRFLEVDGSVVRPDGSKVYGKKFEEKGTDVNIAVHLLNDAWHDRYDTAVLVSNDTDLAEAVRLVREEHMKTVTLLAPLLNRQRDGRPRQMSDALRRVTDAQRQIFKSALVNSQLPNPVIAGNVRLTKPLAW